MVDKEVCERCGAFLRRYRPVGETLCSPCRAKLRETAPPTLDDLRPGLKEKEPLGVVSPWTSTWPRLSAYELKRARVDGGPRQTYIVPARGAELSWYDPLERPAYDTFSNLDPDDGKAMLGFAHENGLLGWMFDQIIELKRLQIPEDEFSEGISAWAVITKGYGQVLYQDFARYFLPEYPQDKDVPFPFLSGRTVFWANYSEPTELWASAILRLREVVKQAKEGSWAALNLSQVYPRLITKADKLGWRWYFRSLLQAFELEIFLGLVGSKIKECAREGCGRIFRYTAGKKYCSDSCRQLNKKSPRKRTDYQRMYGRKRRGQITQEEFKRWQANAKKEVQNG
ncbi:hypothetical protein [Candidatus Hakubella thermalkaliphila]|nr:hypothetical protein [Candidatus Hakubella thermalkaliphila]